MRSIIRPFLLVTALSTAACHGNGGTIANGALNCAEAQVSKLAAVLLPSVTALLTGQSPMWAADLDTLVQSAGAAAICAIELAVTNASPAPTPPPAPVTAKKVKAAPVSPVVVNGNAYLSRHHYRTTK